MSNIRQARALMKLLSLAVVLVIIAELGLLKSDKGILRVKHVIVDLPSQLPSNAYWSLNTTWHTTDKSAPSPPSLSLISKGILQNDSRVKGTIQKAGNVVKTGHLASTYNKSKQLEKLQLLKSRKYHLQDSKNPSLIIVNLESLKLKIDNKQKQKTNIEETAEKLHKDKGRRNMSKTSAFGKVKLQKFQNITHLHENDGVQLEDKQHLPKQQVPSAARPSSQQIHELNNKKSSVLEFKAQQNVKKDHMQSRQDGRQVAQQHRVEKQQTQHKPQNISRHYPQFQQQQHDKHELTGNKTQPVVKLANAQQRGQNEPISTKTEPAKPWLSPAQPNSHKMPDCIPGYTASGTFTARKRFLQWQAGEELDKVVSAIGPDLVLDAGKYFIYRCDAGVMDGCCGWADRVRGILGGYLMANLTGRVFKVEMLDQGCDFTNFYVPNKVNWSLPYSFHQHLNTSSDDLQVLDVVNNHAFSNILPSLHLSKVINSTAKYVYFKGNLNFLVHFRNSKIYKKQLSWMQRVGWHRIHAILFRRLFKLAPKFKLKLEAFLSPALNRAHQSPKPLICAHVRVGDSIAFFKNFNNRMEFPSLDNIWRFIENKSLEFTTLRFTQNRTKQFSKEDLWKDAAVFVTSDSSKVLDIAKNQTFGSAVLTVPGDILHVDKNERFSSEAKCRGLEKLLLEQAVLMNCDVLMISHSGVSTQAASVRSSHSQLYIFTESYDVKPYRLYC